MNLPGQAMAILAEARRLGLELKADGDRLRFRPVDRMTPDLAERLRVHRGEILEALRVLARESPEENAPQSRRTNAPRTDGPPDGGNAAAGSGGRPADLVAPDARKPRGFASARANRPEGAEIPEAGALPFKWNLDDLDRLILLECGWLPHPGPDDLPPTWRREYARLVGLWTSRGIVRGERAEALALMTVLRKMIAAGELRPEEW